MSARTNTPCAAKKMEVLEKTVAHERGRIYQTGSEGREDQKKGKEQRLTTREGEKAIANPEEVQVKEDTAQKGSYKTQWVKVWKNLKKGFKWDNQEKDNPNRPKIWENRTTKGCQSPKQPSNQAGKHCQPYQHNTKG